MYTLEWVGWFWGPLICSYPWPCHEAVRVVYCESRGKHDAYNSERSYGLFQIYAPMHGWRVGGQLQLLFNPETNVRVAWDIYAEAQRIRGYGWQPWSCKP
jgi:hypothetical protein